jgi:hypothetical protein
MLQEFKESQCKKIALKKASEKRRWRREKGRSKIV